MSLSVGYQPDFDIDLRVGQAAERLVLDLITDDTIEVKHDRKALQTGQVYVELWQYRQGAWHPSGLSTTRATVWFFVLCDVRKLMVSIGTDHLRKLVRRFYRTRQLRERDGSHPTRGVGVPLTAITREPLAVPS